MWHVVALNYKIMETSQILCWAYNYLGTIQMEEILYHWQWSMYNSDINGDCTIDDLIYYQLFDC